MQNNNTTLFGLYVEMNSFIQCVIWLLLWVIRLIIAPLARLVQIGKLQRCPPISNEVLLKSGTQLAAMIRNKEVSSEEVVSAYIKRCQEINPVLNAIVQDRFEKALVEARKVDEYLNENPAPADKPLFGVPISVKESLAVEGMSHDAGRYKEDGPTLAKTDADSVQLAKKAGAIPILVSNTPELCMFWETYNKVTGTTRNPYDTRRSAAGSSGGEAALLAAAGSVMGIASDVAGSLRLPAMFCGIYGHKPTPDVVSTVGHYPSSVSKNWDKFFAVGPMTRYAEDLPLMLKAIARPSMLPSLRLDEKIDPKSIRIFYMENDGGCLATNSINSDVTAGLQKAIRHLESSGFQVKKTNIKLLKRSFDVAAHILLSIRGVESLYSCSDDWERTISFWPEVIKGTFGLSKSTAGPILYGPLTATIGSLPDSQMDKIYLIKETLQDEFKNLLGDNSVFLYPTFTSTAHYHNEAFYKIPNTGYMMIFNALGLPVTNCPLGLTENKLPVGCQIVANPFQDRLIFAVAKELEQAFGGWVPPPSI